MPPASDKNFNMNLIKSSALITLYLASVASGFQARNAFRSPSTRGTTFLFDSSAQVRELLEKDYPVFNNLIMKKNTDAWKVLGESEADGFTVFALSDDAMQNLGSKKLEQLADDRNTETAEKIGSYHAVNEPVSAGDLYFSGGIVTVGGVVDVGRSRTGGFFGFGGKEDGGVTVNGANVVKTIQIEDSKSLVHEMDALISPEILWRYVDQLRIPGSS